MPSLRKQITAALRGAGYDEAASGAVADVLVPALSEPLLPEVVGVPEIKEMFGYSPTSQTVEQWRHRGKLVEPDLMVARTPLWLRSTIIKWAEATGRADRLR